MELSGKQRARGKVCVERAHAERPRRDLGGKPHGVDKRAKRRRTDRHPIAEMVRKPAAGRVAVLDRREHRAEKQHEAIGILMVRAPGLRNEFERIAAYFAHVTDAIEQKVVVAAFHSQRHARRANCVERECVVEQANKRTDRARAIVVLALAE